MTKISASEEEKLKNEENQQNSKIENDEKLDDEAEIKQESGLNREINDLLSDLHIGTLSGTKISFSEHFTEAQKGRFKNALSALRISYQAEGDLVKFTEESLRELRAKLPQVTKSYLAMQNAAWGAKLRENFPENRIHEIGGGFVVFPPDPKDALAASKAGLSVQKEQLGSKEKAIFLERHRSDINQTSSRDFRNNLPAFPIENPIPLKTGFLNNIIAMFMSLVGLLETPHVRMAFPSNARIIFSPVRDISLDPDKFFEKFKAKQEKVSKVGPVQSHIPTSFLRQTSSIQPGLKILHTQELPLSLRGKIFIQEGSAIPQREKAAKIIKVAQNTLKEMQQKLGIPNIGKLFGILKEGDNINFYGSSEFSEDGKAGIGGITMHHQLSDKTTNQVNIPIEGASELKGDTLIHEVGHVLSHNNIDPALRARLDILAKAVQPELAKFHKEHDETDIKEMAAKGMAWQDPNYHHPCSHCQDGKESGFDYVSTILGDLAQQMKKPEFVRQYSEGEMPALKEFMEETGKLIGSLAERNITNDAPPMMSRL